MTAVYPPPDATREQVEAWHEQQERERQPAPKARDWKLDPATERYIDALGRVRQRKRRGPK